MATLASPQEFVRLRRAGIQVMRIAGAFASLHVTAGQQTLRAARWTAGNSELENLTMGIYEARRLAMERLRGDARRLHASGVVGIDIGDARHRHKRGVEHMTVEVQAWGTAVRRMCGTPPDPSPILAL